MTRAPDDPEERPAKGGRAAERLRQFLAERFGDEAPPIPPDEEGEPEDEGERAEGDDQPRQDDDRPAPGDESDREA